ncbi:MAG: nicotinamide-nucleotide amidohydrolase family protein [Planctomycetota bacterium]|jgi:nicotinamide-nucleotide amidase|nr:nicotinamide-nucleotide amidohydrolase family protein [Planctomycetota bacterium]
MKSQQPRVCVLAIGDEILNGRIVDTNSSFLGTELLKLSLPISHKRCISDQPQQLASTLEELSKSFDLIISSGGLGPTADDRVYSEVAQFGLICNKLKNPAGLADGLHLQFENSCHYLALPGPPIECQQSFDCSVAPLLSKLFPDLKPIAYHTMHFVGTHEAELANQISDMFEPGNNPLLGITASELGVTISLLAHATANHPADHHLQLARDTIAQRLSKWLWGEGDMTLASEVVATAKQQQLKVAFAESCTGGKLAASLIDVPGASAVVGSSWVVYSNEAKTEQLGVAHDLIERNGAVSEQVAIEMARGALSRAKADIAVSVTGIAGPDGGSDEKPVGTVCFAIASKDGVYSMTRQQYVLGGRSRIQAQSVRDGLFLVLQLMRGQIVLPNINKML